MLVSTQRSPRTSRPTSTCTVQHHHFRCVLRQRNVSQQGLSQPLDAVSAEPAGAAAPTTNAAVVRPISNQPSPLDPSTGYVPTECDSDKVTHCLLVTPLHTHLARAPHAAPVMPSLLLYVQQLPSA
jgi:hypothetical protein